jgi:hypothetical protein
MDYQEVYYIDDGRNARLPFRDPRLARPTVRPALMPAAPPPAAPPVLATTTVPTVGAYQYAQPAFYGPSGYYGPTAVPQGWAGYPVNPQYVMPPVAAPNNLASILGGFGDIGTLANIAAQVFAAFMPLPEPPTPQDSTDNDTATRNAMVNSSNLIRYQNALALFAKRDQQILTLGSVLKELFKRPGTPGVVMG